MLKKYLAEFVGTFTLSFVVLAGVVNSETVSIGIPVLAGLTLGLFVYTVGSISGAHLNPAVTVGLLSVKKIAIKDATFYILAQIIGAVIAIFLVKFLGMQTPAVVQYAFDSKYFTAEILGTFFFTFGIASIVFGENKQNVSGLIVGGSLILGIMIALFCGSLGILNPAVALALNSANVSYVLGPVIGSILGFQFYRFLYIPK